jgi:hypothetical protein
VIIGISGKIGHGKDTIASYLVRTRGFKILRMADPLKSEVLERLPRTLHAIRDYAYPGALKPTFEQMVFDLKPAGVRELLQEYGTEVRRADDPDYWVDQWKDAARKYQNIVVPDVRFANEAAAIRDSGGELWLVTRPGCNSASTHESETFVDRFYAWNLIMFNSGTVEDLEHLVETEAVRLSRAGRIGRVPEAVALDENF